MAVNADKMMNAKASAHGGGAAPETARGRRLKYGLSMAALLLSLVVILAVANWLAAESPARFDLTAGRAYSLSEQTRGMLKRLDNPVQIMLLFAENDPRLGTDEQRLMAASRRQVEDVLREFQSRSENVTVTRIDPTDPRTIAEYDRLVEHLRAIFAEEIAAYETTIAEGRQALKDLGDFATPQSEALATAMNALSAEHANYPVFRTIVQVLLQIPQEVAALDQRAGQMLEVGEGTGETFPDLEGAVSTVNAGLQLRSGTMRNVADFFDRALAEGNLPEALVTHLNSVKASFSAMADKLADVQERLADLEPLRLSPIDRAMRQQNCVLLTNAANAAVLPYDELFPPPSVRDLEQQDAVIDRRFAGETVIASGIRQLMLGDEKLQAILVHAERVPSVRMGAPQGLDLSLVASSLEDQGFEVQEWNVNQGARPEVNAVAGTPVWVIVPPPPGQQSMMAGSQLALAAKALIDDGHNVLLSLFPSMIPGFGQNDPWNEALEALGVSADTARVIVERVPQPGAQDAMQPALVLMDYEADHPVAAAVRGLPTFLLYPVPLSIATATSAEEAADDEDAGGASEETQTRPEGDVESGEAAATQSHDDHDDSLATRTVLLATKPNDRIFATEGWMSLETVEPPREPVTEPMGLVIAVERGGVGGAQRAVVVGSGNWMWTEVVGLYDLATSLPLHAGNAELFTASTLWLAQMDEMIARSPRADAVPRVENLSRGGKIAWNWILVGGLPVVCLAAGVAVALSRRG